MNRKLYMISFVVNVIFSSFLCGMQNAGEPSRLTDDCAFDCFFGRTERIVQAIDDDPSLIEAVDYRGKTLLAIAARSGYVDIVEALLQRRANINTVDQDGSSALMHAAANPRGFAMVKYLVDQGADLTLVHCKKQKKVHEIAMGKAEQTTSPGLVGIAQMLTQAYKKQHEPE